MIQYRGDINVLPAKKKDVEGHGRGLTGDAVRCGWRKARGPLPEQGGAGSVQELAELLR